MYQFVHCGNQLPDIWGTGACCVGGENSNCHSLFCIPTGPWDRPSELKRGCTTIWEKGYTYFWLMTFSQQLGSHAVLKGVHTEEAIWLRKISKEIPGSSKQLKDLVFCQWCSLNQQQNQALIHHLLKVHYKMCLVCPICWDYYTTYMDKLCQHFKDEHDLEDEAKVGQKHLFSQ